MFALLAADIHFQQEIERLPGRGGLAAEAPRDFEPVHRMDQDERPQRHFGLAALDCADGVPTDGVQAGLGCGIGFFPQFFQPIFTEVELAGGRGLGDERERFCFAHRHERDFIRRTLRASRGLGHTSAYLAQVVSNRHSSSSQSANFYQDRSYFP